ncbi:MAG: hypothetical protein Q9191_007713, partial [Dirinaria sp. TL-2023a]
RLDAEGQDGDIVIIDSDTATNHAVWYALSTGASETITGMQGVPPKAYPGEVTIWKVHIVTQHLPLEYDFLNGAGKHIWEDLPEPYDPHDPQIPPYSMGVDYGTKEGAMSNGWYFFPTVTAGPGEYEFSDDAKARHNPRFSLLTRLMW